MQSSPQKAAQSVNVDTFVAQAKKNPNVKRVILLGLVISLAVSGVMIVISRSTISNVSALTASGGVAVYWNRNCTGTVSLINWGNLTRGTVKSVVVYVRNEAAEKIHLYVLTINWNPQAASSYLTLSWNCTDGRVLNPGEIISAKLSLSVSLLTQGVTTFSFKINVIGSTTLLGDVNGDGSVNVLDLIIVAKALGTYPGDSKYNPNADINGDGVIDILDLILVAKYST
jgi:hypothetical protein